MDWSITTTFIVYIVAMLAVGILASRYTKNLSDYILGGRRLGSFVTALSAGASDMSGWLLLGLPGALYLSGICEAWIAVGLTIGAWFNWKLIASRLRVFTEISNNSLTLPDYFTERFRDKRHLLAIISAVVILLFFVVYCAAGMVSGAKLFSQTFGMEYEHALYAGCAATIAYVFIGGFLAVSWTDTIQASLMAFALMLTPIMLIVAVGGVSEAMEAIKTVKPQAADLFSGDSAVATTVMLISCLGWGLGYMGQPHILVRFMAANSSKQMAKSRRICITWMIITLAGASAIGFFGIAYVAMHPELADLNVKGHEETVFIVISKSLFNPWIAGILLSAILAAIMSTLSCQLLVASSALTEDFYHHYLRPKASQKELVICGRLTLLAVAVIAVVIAMDPNSSVLGLVSWAWAGFGAAFGPIVLLSLFWRKMNLTGALCGIIAGVATVILWSTFKADLLGLYELVPGFIVNCLVIFIVSSITHKETSECAAYFDKLNDAYHKSKIED